MTPPPIGELDYSQSEEGGGEREASAEGAAVGAAAKGGVVKLAGRQRHAVLRRWLGRGQQVDRP